MPEKLFWDVLFQSHYLKSGSLCLKKIGCNPSRPSQKHGGHGKSIRSSVNIGTFSLSTWSSVQGLHKTAEQTNLQLCHLVHVSKTQTWSLNWAEIRYLKLETVKAENWLILNLKTLNLVIKGPQNWPYTWFHILSSRLFMITFWKIGLYTSNCVEVHTILSCKMEGLPCRNTCFMQDLESQLKWSFSLPALWGTQKSSSNNCLQKEKITNSFPGIHLSNVVFFLFCHDMFRQTLGFGDGSSYTVAPVDIPTPLKSWFLCPRIISTSSKNPLSAKMSKILEKPRAPGPKSYRVLQAKKHHGFSSTP